MRTCAHLPKRFAASRARKSRRLSEARTGGPRRSRAGSRDGRSRPHRARELREDLGGPGVPCLTSGLIAEAIGYADVNVAHIQILGSLNGKIIATHASRAQASEWIPTIVSGELIVAIGLTEPRGGSDPANLALSARRGATRIAIS